MSQARERMAAPCDRFRREAALPADLVPATRPAPDGSAILVTGATGFLGSHLLTALLERSSAPIICLVRGDAAIDEARLRARLATLGAIAGDRLSVISASITEPGFGLSPQAFARLADSVGVVFHLAAQLDFRKSFEALQAVNVHPLRQVLSLAASGVAKRILYVSSLSVLETTANYSKTVTETTTLADPELLPLGYAQTKWTAEQLLAAARGRGFNVVRVRPSWIVGEDLPNVETDFIASLVRVFAAVGATPEEPGALNLVPVSFVAEACALIGLAGAGAAEPPHGVFHLGMPQAASTGRFAEAIAATGRPMARVKLAVFLARLAAELKATRALELLMFRHILVGSASRAAIGLPYLDGRAPIFDSTASLQILQAAGLPPPTLDLAALARRYRLLPAEP
jgi:thioester reductase-like protein